MDDPKIEIIEAAGVAPSAQIVAGAAKQITVTDAQGRSIVLRKPNPLANLDFAKACGGPELNLVYLAEVAHLKFVASIDGDAIPTPTTELQLRALYQRLGDDGNEAAQKAVGQLLATTAATREAQDAAIKNF